MSIGKVFWKSFTNLRTWKALCVILAFLFGLFMMGTSHQPELAKGFIRGRDMGILLTATAQLNRAAEAGKAVDLAAVQETIEKTRDEVKKRSPSALALPYIEPVITALAHYQSVLTRGGLEPAKTILTSEVAPSSRVLSDQLNEVNRKMDEEIETKAQNHEIIWKGFLVFLFLGLLSLVSLLSQWMNGDMDGWHLDILQAKMPYPYNYVILKYFIEKNKLEDDKEEMQRLSHFHFLPIFTPDIDDLAKDRESVLTRDCDLTNELTAAEAFAYYLSDEKAVFQKPPAGACNIRIRHHDLTHALVHWMDEIRRDQKIEMFAMESEWNGKEWIVTLHTMGEPVHESIYSGYRQVMEKKAGLDNKNNNVLDFVRAALRKSCSNFTVTHENGNLNLVMTFAPQ